MPRRESAKKIARQILAGLCHLDLIFIDDALKIEPENAYRDIFIPKKSGGVRKLAEPCKEYKIIQHTLLSLLYKDDVMDCVFGFCKGGSPVLNAEHHLRGARNKLGEVLLLPRIPRWVLTIDLKDAFPSVKSGTLRDVFCKMFHPSGFSPLKYVDEEMRWKVFEELVSLAIRFTTHNGCLPQGAPTSPYLLNLVIQDLGIIQTLKKLCENRKYPINISFYADDITFSAAKQKISAEFIKQAVAIIEKGGVFKVNQKKTRLNSNRYKAHKITGVVLSEGYLSKTQYGFYRGPKLTLPQKTLKIWRGNIHRATKALQEGRSLDQEKGGITFEEVTGFICWIKSVYKNTILPASIKKPIERFECELENRGKKEKKNN